MSVYRMKDKPHGKRRKLPWRASVPRKGRKPLTKQFKDEKEAQLWHAARAQ